jgi:hypothetical protein
MTITAGSLSQVATASTTITVLGSASTGGVAPVTYQWYRSTTSGFTPGSGNSVSGATSLTLNDSGLIPNTKYYYELVSADSTASLASTSQIAITTTAPVLSQNQFAQVPFVGVIDMTVGTTNVMAAQIDVSAGTTLFYPGQFVKLVTNNNGGVPKVVGVTANNDKAIGAIKFNIKDISYGAGQNCEIAMWGTVMWFYATGAITQGNEVCVDVTSPGGVQATGNTATFMGTALDGAAAAATLIRVLLVPNVAYATA